MTTTEIQTVPLRCDMAQELPRVYDSETGEQSDIRCDGLDNRGSDSNLWISSCCYILEDCHCYLIAAHLTWSCLSRSAMFSTFVMRAVSPWWGC